MKPKTPPHWIGGPAFGAGLVFGASASLNFPWELSALVGLLIMVGSFAWLFGWEAGWWDRNEGRHSVWGPSESKRVSKTAGSTP